MPPGSPVACGRNWWYGRDGEVIEYGERVSIPGRWSSHTIRDRRERRRPEWSSLHSGKIRDLYADGPDLLLVASDKVSVYDVVLPTPIPGKGKILTQLSLWWFDRLAGIVPNHVISATDVPPQWAGRAIRCRRLEMIPVECIARGYLAGLGLDSYRAYGTVSGVPLPPGLAEGSKLPEPVFTPSTKATIRAR